MPPEHNIRLSTAALAVPLILAASPAGAWPGGYLGRLQAEALIQTLRGDLLSQGSATAVLARWCAAHRLADPPRIVARKAERRETASAETRALLKVGPREPLGYRRVELVCGDHVLSAADNWYVPARLTPSMNHALLTTDTPFGAVVAPLGFQRRTLEATVLFHPMPPGWKAGAATTPSGADVRLVLPDVLLRVRAILSRRDGRPISLVVEDYRRGLLDFEPSAPK